MIKILFLTANPVDTQRIRLDEEIRSIRERIRAASHRDAIVLEQEWAVRVGDLQAHLLRHQPHIVHFSGHGSRNGAIILEDIVGRRMPVSPATLRSLFSTLKDNIRCVVLNACYSQDQAEAIASVIEFVVGMTDAIGDASAISFAAGFYQALAFGRDIGTSFELGKGQIDLEGLSEKDTPRLFHRPGLDPARFYLLDTGGAVSNP
jgi:hypothetical protein